MRGSEKVIEDRYLAGQEGCEEERLTSFLWVLLTKYMDDIFSHNIVDNCVEISEKGDGPCFWARAEIRLVKIKSKLH
jgi:hypothetical protein